jgi:hypothetical protein
MTKMLVEVILENYSVAEVRSKLFMVQQKTLLSLEERNKFAH